MEEQVLNEKFTDWVFHYQYICRKRRTEKQKKRLISGLLSDLQQLGIEGHVMKYRSDKKSDYYNVVAGDLKNAEKVVISYYDTPYSHTGDLVFFDADSQRKKTMQYMAASMILFLLLCAVCLVLFVRLNPLQSGVWMPLWMLLFTGLFFLAVSIRNGGLSMQGPVRNTSSILTMLSMMEQEGTDRIAYVFVDEGTTSQAGLKAILKQIPRKAKVITLDCIGADAPLQEVRRGSVVHLLGAQEKDGKYYLQTQQLKQKEINRDNIDQAISRILAV